MSGMRGHYNAAAERKLLMISFDDDDNILSTEVAAITIVSNGLTAGRKYPNIPAAAEFYAYNERSPTGWKRGPNVTTARSITGHQQFLKIGLRQPRRCPHLF